MAPPLPPTLAQDGLRARKFKTARTVTALMLREMATTYGRSPGGYAWAILEPVGAVAILSFIFSYAFRSPSLGTNFAQFYATAYLPFMMYSTLAAKVSQSIRFSKPLLAYPSVTYVDALVARFLLNGLTQVMVFYIVMTGLVLVFDTRPILDLPRILGSLAMTAALGFGIGTINCFALAMAPVWEQIWMIVNRPLFIISGVFFLYEDVPQPIREWLWWNPLFHVTGEMRAGFYATYEASYVSYAYVFAVSGVVTVLGLVFLGRFHREILTNR